jgi:hypothetical protein
LIGQLCELCANLFKMQFSNHFVNGLGQHIHLTSLIVSMIGITGITTLLRRCYRFAPQLVL